MFPNCNEGFSFYFGGRGGPVFARRCFHGRNRRQPFATVCDEDAMAVPMGSAAKADAFGGLKRRTTSFRVAAWHLVTFQHVSHHVKNRCV